MRLLAAVAGVVVLLAGFALGATNDWWFVSIGVLALGAGVLNWSLPRHAAEPVILGMDHEDDKPSISAYSRHQCPCCACPTINGDIGVTTCLLCEWDSAPNPAQQPPLDRARENVRAHLWAYSPSQLPPWRSAPPSRRENALKAELVRMYAQMKAEPEAEDQRWPKVLLLEQQLGEAERQNIDSQLGEVSSDDRAILDSATIRHLRGPSV